jgi:hypothetical protein
MQRLLGPYGSGYLILHDVTHWSECAAARAGCVAQCWDVSNCAVQYMVQVSVQVFTLWTRCCSIKKLRIGTQCSLLEGFAWVLRQTAVVSLDSRLRQTAVVSIDSRSANQKRRASRCPSVYLVISAHQTHRRAMAQVPYNCDGDSANANVFYRLWWGP